MKAGVLTITSVHLSLKAGLGGETLTGEGDETASKGHAKDVSLTERIGSVGTMKLITVGGKTYIQLPSMLRTSKQRTSHKPWSLVTPIGKSLQSATAFAGPDSAAQFIQATNSLVLKGTETLDGVRVGHYSIVVSVAKLPASYPQRATLEQAGLSTLPMQMWIDQQGRGRKMLQTVTTGSTPRVACGSTSTPAARSLRCILTVLDR